MKNNINLDAEIRKTEELLASLRKKQAEQKIRLEDCSIGDVVNIAGFDFIIVGKRTPFPFFTGTADTILLSKDLLLENEKFGDTPDYSKSNVRSKLEGEILPQIEDAVGEDNVCNIETDLTAVNGINEYGRKNFKIRPLTFEEVRRFNEFIPNKDLDDWWWTCTPWSSKGRDWEKCVTVVSPSGYIHDHDCDLNFGVRPVCILKSSIFVSKGEQ